MSQDVSARYNLRGLRKLIFILLCAQLSAPGTPSHVDDVEVRLAHIQRAIQNGDLRAARREAGKALQSFPSDPRLYNFLGVIDAQEKNAGGAEIDFRRAIAIAPSFTGAYLNLGRLYQEQMALEEALGVYEKLLEISPNEVEAIYQASSLLYRLSRFRESQQYLAHLSVEARHSAAALSLSCANHAALDQSTQAKACAKELIAARDITDADVVPFVPVYKQHRQEAVAVTLLEALLRRNAASNAALDELAMLYEKNKRFTEARDVLTRELPVNGPPPLELLNRLAEISYRSGDLKGALAYLAHARDLAPGNAAIHFLFGLVCIDLKLPPEATQSLRKAVQLGPKNPYYNYALGAVLLQQRQPDEAIRLFRQFRDAKPDDPRGRFALGVAFFDAERTKEAREQFEAASRDPATRGGALLYLGRLASRDNSLPKAEELLLQSVQENPTSPDARAELALVQIRRNEYALARKTLAQAIRLSPADYRTNLHLLLLYRRTKDPRADEQARRVGKLQMVAEDRERTLLRSLDIRPY